MVENGDFMVEPRRSPEQSSMQPQNITIGREPTRYSSATDITHEGDISFMQIYNEMLRNPTHSNPENFIKSVADACKIIANSVSKDSRLNGEGSAIAVTRSEEGVKIINYNGRVFSLDPERTVTEIPRTENGISEVHLSPEKPLQIIAIAGTQIPNTVTPQSLQEALSTHRLEELLDGDGTLPFDNRVSLTVYPYNPDDYQAMRQKEWHDHVTSALEVANDRNDRRVPAQPPMRDNTTKV